MSLLICMQRFRGKPLDGGDKRTIESQALSEVRVGGQLTRHIRADGD
jgi:hypothetical protein